MAWSGDGGAWHAATVILIIMLGSLYVLSLLCVVFTLVARKKCPKLWNTFKRQRAPRRQMDVDLEDPEEREHLSPRSVAGHAATRQDGLALCHTLASYNTLHGQPNRSRKIARIVWSSIGRSLLLPSLSSLCLSWKRWPSSSCANTIKDGAATSPTPRATQKAKYVLAKRVQPSAACIWAAESYSWFVAARLFVCAASSQLYITASFAQLIMSD